MDSQLVVKRVVLLESLWVFQKAKQKEMNSVEWSDKRSAERKEAHLELNSVGSMERCSERK
jgi:hypothetical protein